MLSIVRFGKGKSTVLYILQKKKIKQNALVNSAIYKGLDVHREDFTRANTEGSPQGANPD